MYTNIHFSFNTNNQKWETMQLFINRRINYGILKKQYTNQQEKVLLHLITRMNLTDIILSKGSQTQKINMVWFSFTWNFQMVNTNPWLKFRTVAATWQKLQETNRKGNFLEWQQHSVSWERWIHLSRLIELYIIQPVYFNIYKIYLQKYKQPTKR